MQLKNKSLQAQDNRLSSRSFNVLTRCERVDAAKCVFNFVLPLLEASSHRPIQRTNPGPDMCKVQLKTQFIKCLFTCSCQPSYLVPEDLKHLRTTYEHLCTPGSLDFIRNPYLQNIQTQQTKSDASWSMVLTGM